MVPPIPDRDLDTFVCELLPGESTGFADVTFTPDGTKLLTRSIDNRLRTWDIANRTQDEAISFEVDPAIGSAFNAQCTHIATASADHKVRIWNIAAKTIDTTLTGHTHVVECVAFSPDGQRLVSGSFDSTARIWDLTTGQVIHTLNGPDGHTGRVMSVAFDRAGARVVTGGEDHTVRIWDAQSGALLQTLEGHEGPINCAVFSPDGFSLASGSDDKTIRLWNIASGLTTRTYEEHTEGILWVDFGLNGARLMSGARDNSMRLWRVPTSPFPTPTTSLAVNTDHRSDVTRVRFFANTPTIASISAGGSIRIWDAFDQTKLIEIRMDFMLVRVAVTIVDHNDNDKVTKGTMGVIVYLAINADTAANGLETNHKLRLSFGRFDELTKFVVTQSGQDIPGIEASMRETLDRDLPLGIAQGQQVSQIRMRKFFDGPEPALGIYVDLALRSGPGNVFRGPRGVLALAQDFRDPDKEIAFATSPGLFALLGPDAKFQRAELKPGSTEYHYPLRKDMFDPTSEELGSIDSVSIGPRMFLSPNSPPAPTGQLEVRVGGDYEGIGFTAFFYFDPRRDADGIVDWHTDSDVDLGLLGTLLVLLGGMVLLLPLLPAAGVGIYLLVGALVSLVPGREIAEYIANKKMADSVDAESQASVLNSMPFRLLAAFRRWDPFYLTNHQVVAKLDEQMVIDQFGIAFEASGLVLDKQVVPQDDVAPSEEVREMGNIVWLRYDVPGFVPLNDAGEFTATGPGVDRLPFTRDDPVNDPTLVTLTIDQIVERKALNRVLAPIVLEARRINMFEGQIDQLLCVTWRVRTQQRNRLIDAFQRAKRAEIGADLRPEELIELQKLGIVTLDSKDIIVRHNKNGIVTPYYRDHPDANPKDNLLSLPHYSFPYVPPPPP
jgi:WD40 repeat protein